MPSRTVIKPSAESTSPLCCSRLASKHCKFTALQVDVQVVPVVRLAYQPAGGGAGEGGIDGGGGVDGGAGGAGGEEGGGSIIPTY